jgi:rRNA maturation endonuclease Nob1
MKKTIVQCDICGGNITRDNVRFKFKKYENTRANHGDFEFQKWNKLDICLICYHRFLRFIEMERKKTE